MSGRLRWAVEGRDWPNAEASRIVAAGGLHWHVQRAGAGPTVLLLHGAGAATHSWRDVLPILAERFDVIAPDLPGHGFTSPAPGLASLPAVVGWTRALLVTLEARPALVVGHSAGGAIALRLALDGAVGEAPVLALNGALKPFAGAAAPLFRGLAMGLFANPLAVGLFASAARDPRRVERVLEGTGSEIDSRGVELYGRLFRSTAHVAATLGMMAAWDVAPTLRELNRLRSPLTLAAGDRDQAVPPSVSREVAASVPNARFVALDGLGHLAHEEAPDRAAALIAEAALGPSKEAAA